MPKFSRFLCAFFSLCFTLFSYADLDLSEKGTIAFAQRILKEYPEASWLIDENVAATLQGDPKTPKTSWSSSLKGRHYIEFERTISSILCLYAFNEGGDTAYTWFTKNQKVSDKLTRENFDAASALVQGVVQKYSLKLLEINLLFGDLGKTPTARRLAAEHGIAEGDHDIFLAQCLAKFPNIFPTYKTLEGLGKDTIRKYAGLLHFGHLWHVEGTATAMLSILKESRVLENPEDFDFEFVCHLCDIAAVLAHVNNEGSLILTNDAYETMQEAMATVRALSTHTPNDALQVYLDLRAKRSHLMEIADLRERNVLARLASMMRLRKTTPEEGTLLKAAWAKMPDKGAVLATLNPLRTDQKIPTPTYVPAVLDNLRGALSKAEEDTQKVMNVVIGTALPWVMNVIEVYERKVGKTYPEGLTLNFNAIGGAVRSNLHALDGNPSFQIDTKSGAVTLEG